MRWQSFSWWQRWPLWSRRFVIGSIGSCVLLVLGWGWLSLRQPTLPGAIEPRHPLIDVTPELPSPTSAAVSPTLDQMSPRLQIEQLAIDVPITWDVDGFDEAAYLRALETGIAHFAGTAHPGDGGNIFLFGHSGYRRKLPADMHRIFRRLNDLARGDQIVVWDGKTLFRYQVTEEREIAADDLTVLEPTATETVTLMTCWPPGTLDRRYIIRAERLPDR